MIKSDFDNLADSAFVRLADLLDKPALICVSRPTLWRMVKRAEFPHPVKLTAGVTAWRVGEIRDWMESLRGDGSSPPTLRPSNKVHCGGVK